MEGAAPYFRHRFTGRAQLDQANDQDNRDVQEGMLSFVFFTLL